MVYLTLYVKDINTTIQFYTEKLELFNLLGDRRLVCKYGPQLCLDIREADKTHFIEFGIYFEEGISIISLLEKAKIQYTLKNDLGGSSVNFEDNSGNKVNLSCDCGELK